MDTCSSFSWYNKTVNTVSHSVGVCLCFFCLLGLKDVIDRPIDKLFCTIINIFFKHFVAWSNKVYNGVTIFDLPSWFYLFLHNSKKLPKLTQK